MNTFTKPILGLLNLSQLSGGEYTFYIIFENEGDRRGQTEYFLPKVQIKYCNIVIDGKIYFISLSEIT